jgi:hypothetical protein
MERYCLTGQSSQRAVAPMEEEEDLSTQIMDEIKPREEDVMQSL